MKKNIFILIAFFALVPVLVAAQTEPIELSFEESKLSVPYLSYARYNLTITNNQPYLEKLAVYVKGPRLEWVMNAYSVVNLKPFSSESLEIILYPLEFEPDELEYTVTANSRYRSDVTATTGFALEVLHPVVMEDFFAELDGYNLNINLVMNFRRQESTDVVFDVRDNQGSQVMAKSLPVEGIGEGVFSETIPLPEDTEPGEYTVIATLRGTDMTITREFILETYHNVIETMETVESPLMKTVTITIENQGNSMETNYITYQKIPQDFLTGFAVAPDSCYGEGDDRTCTFVIDRLAPGVTAQITYTTHYWPVYAQYGLVAIILISIIALSVKRAARPKIRKRHIKGKDKHSIVLEIRNPFMHHLKNVVIRDWVSPLARVLHEEFESVKPIMKKSEAGTELIWRLGDLKPKEDRVLHYKIKPMVVGGLKMPKAYLRFLDKTGKRVRIFSKSILVE